MFLRNVWAAGILKTLEKAHVYAAIANRNYEGLVANLGDKVRVLTVGGVEAKSYSVNTDIDTPQNITGSETELDINQAVYFNFKVNDVVAVQEKPQVLNQITANASYAIRDSVDTYMGGLHAQATHQLYQTGTTPFSVNSVNVDDVLIAASELFGQNNVPRENRFMIVPEWFHSKLVIANLVIRKQNEEIFDNGYVNRVLGWDIYVSNNVAVVGGVSKIIAGIKQQSFSFAGAINKIESYRPEKRFEDAIKGLFVYGAKIMRPAMTMTIHANKANEP